MISAAALTGAGLFELRNVDTSVVGWGPLLTGTVVSFVVAYASIAWLLQFVAKHKITVFVGYRVAAGAALALLLATGYALLTAYWRPLERALGWFLVPLGRASLYVFVLHVPVALLVANVPGLSGAGVALGTLAHGLVLGVLWTLVHRQVLFRVIPR